MKTFLSTSICLNSLSSLVEQKETFFYFIYETFLLNKHIVIVK